MWKAEKKEFKEILVKVNEIQDEKERGRYRKLFTDWHMQEKNKERSHSRKRDLRSLEYLEAPEILEREKYKPSVLTRLYRQESFEEILFSESSVNLHELVTDGTLSRIIKELTLKQKQALFYVGVWKHSTKEAGEKLGVSERNIRKLYATALYHIKGKIYPVINFRHKFETEEEYRDIAREKGIHTTYSERKFAETADEEIRGYYGAMTNK